MIFYLVLRGRDGLRVLREHSKSQIQDESGVETATN
jgi:hypothetical protein